MEAAWKGLQERDREGGVCGCMYLCVDWEVVCVHIQANALLPPPFRSQPYSTQQRWDTEWCTWWSPHEALVCASHSTHIDSKEAICRRNSYNERVIPIHDKHNTQEEDTDDTDDTDNLIKTPQQHVLCHTRS